MENFFQARKYRRCQQRCQKVRHAIRSSQRFNRCILCLRETSQKSPMAISRSISSELRIISISRDAIVDIILVKEMKPFPVKTRNVNFESNVSVSDQFRDTVCLTEHISVPGDCVWS